MKEGWRKGGKREGGEEGRREGVKEVWEAWGYEITNYQPSTTNHQPSLSHSLTPTLSHSHTLLLTYLAQDHHPENLRSNRE